MLAGGAMALLKVLDLHLKNRLVDMQQSSFATLKPKTVWKSLFLLKSTQRWQKCDAYEEESFK